MSAENPKEPLKQSPKDIESFDEKELWASLNHLFSSESLERVFEETKSNLASHPDLYYLEVTGTNAIVRKITDNRIVYMTEDAVDIEELIKASGTGN